MPRYSNSNSSDVMLGWLRIPARNYIDTEAVFATLPDGVTKTELLPDSNPIITSQLLTGATSYAIPDSYANYQIRIFCKAGTIAVKFNDATLTPALTLVAGEQVGLQVINRTVGVVIIEVTAGPIEVKLDIIRDAAFAWGI